MVICFWSKKYLLLSTFLCRLTRTGFLVTKKFQLDVNIFLPQANKTVATSPIQEVQEKRPAHQVQHLTQSPLGKSGLAAQKPSSHVRFLSDFHPSSLIDKPKAEAESSESETENTTNDEEGQTCEKFLLLIDQPSVEHKTKRHLSIKDIGVILDRLSSKIIDVERLDREIEDECFNWTIKAVIRGDSLRELGVLYGGHYYTICEHPAYGTSKQEEEEAEDEEEEEKEVLEHTFCTFVENLHVPTSLEVYAAFAETIEEIILLLPIKEMQPL
ncbi:hypothetical protein Avbf_00193 [Armadillidium vulgare]|nr:hypothetical protein Avbf_00193 [Armadillidium vulgare]